MIPRARFRALFIAICLLLALNVHRTYAETTASKADRLLELAATQFRPLSLAETRMVRGAAMRNLVWLGPSDDPDSPENDLNHADNWPPERVVRAELIRWLVSDAEAGRLLDPSGPGFAGAAIKGQLDFSFLSIARPLTMVSCHIPKGIDLSNAHAHAIDLRRSFTGPIDADSSNIDGDVSMIRGHYGPVSFFRAQIAGNLDLIGARVSNPGADSVSATEAVIGGDADFHQGFTTDGMVDFQFAKVGHSLSFNDAHFVGTADNGLNAERAAIAGIIYWVNVTHTPKTILDLANTRAQAIGDDAASWPAPGNLNLDGFIYDSIVDGPTDSVARLRWLNLQPAGYKPQPFEQLAKVLAADGREDDAVDVRIAQREAQRQIGTMVRLEKIWNLVLEVTIGYGFRPLRAIWWMIAFVAIGTTLFGIGYRMRIVTPIEAEAYRRFVETGNTPAHYPPFNAFVYSLQNFLPLVELHQGAYWRPNPRHLAGGESGRGSMLPARMLRWYLWVHILAGWILTPLLLAGLSGLIRPG